MTQLYFDKHQKHLWEMALMGEIIKTKKKTQLADSPTGLFALIGLLGSEAGPTPARFSAEILNS